MSANIIKTVFTYVSYIYIQKTDNLKEKTYENYEKQTIISK